jgi:hypothetical protein
LIAEPTTPSNKILLKTKPVTAPIQNEVRIGWCKDVKDKPSTSSTKTAKTPQDPPMAIDAIARTFSTRLSRAMTIQPLVENN